MAQKQRQIPRHYLRIVFWLGIIILGSLCLAAFLGLVGFLFKEAGSLLTVTWSILSIIFISLLLALLCLGWVGISFLFQDRQADLIPFEDRQAAPIIRIYPERMDERDYEVIESILREQKCKGKVALYPLQGGFSTAELFEVNCHGQHPTVLKLGPEDKIRTEVENYGNFVEGKIVTISLRGTAYRRGRGALLYPYATLTHGQSKTFEEMYKQDSDTNNVITIIKNLFDNTVGTWFDEASFRGHQYLYQNYNLNESEWGRIREAIRGLNFDPDAENFPEFNFHYSPLKEARRLFENRQDQAFSTKLAVLHGDLNARNIMIDSNNNVFLIDFAKTGIDHLLRDFCRLEVEIKYVLTRLLDDTDVQSAVDLDRKLLLDHNTQHFSTLEELLTIRLQLDGPLTPKFDRMMKSIEVLRQIAYRAMGVRDQPSDQYYIGLLHYTLDALRYQQCDNLSKRFALQSVAILCQALNPGDNQSRVH